MPFPEPAGLMPQGQRPQGYGRPSNLPPQGNSILHTPLPGYQQQGYTQPNQQMGVSALARLVSNLNQTQFAPGTVLSNDDQPGFNGYTFQRGQNNSAQQPASQFVQVQTPNDEEQQAATLHAAKEYSSRIAVTIYDKLANKNDRPYQIVKQVLKDFESPKTGIPDGVVNEYIDEINSNIMLYRYCCSYSCILLTAIFTEQVVQNNHIQLQNDDRFMAYFLAESFRTVVALQFLDWLEKHPRSLLMASRLLPKTLMNIENLENKMDGIEGIVLSASDARMPIRFPWKRGTLRRIYQTVEVGSGTYDAYIIQNGGLEERPEWNAPISTQPSEDISMPSWYKSYKKALFADEARGQEDSHYGRDKEIIILNPVNDNWGDKKPQPPIAPEPTSVPEETKEVEVVKEKPLATTQTVEPTIQPTQAQPTTIPEDEQEVIDYVERGIIDNGINKWLIRIPNSVRTEYAIAPKYFRHLSEMLEYKGSDFSHNVAPVEDFYIPIIESMDLKRGYTCKMFYVGDEPGNVEMYLNAPEKIYQDSLISTISRVDEYRKKTGEFKLEKGEGLEHKEIVIVKEAIKCTSKSALDDTVDMIQLIKDRYETPPTNIIMPVEINEPIWMACNNKFNLEELDFTLQPLVYDVPCSQSFIDVCNLVEMGLGAIGSQGLTYLVKDHLDNLFKRFLSEYCLIECTDLFKGTEDLNLIDKYGKVLERLNDIDKEAYNSLKDISAISLFREHLPLFANRTQRKEFIESELAKIDNKNLKEAKRRKLNKAFIQHKRFVIIKTSEQNVPDFKNKHCIIDSNHKELIYLAASANKYINKPKYNEYPVVIMKDDGKCELNTFIPAPKYRSRWSVRKIDYKFPLTFFRVLD